MSQKVLLFVGLLAALISIVCYAKLIKPRIVSNKRVILTPLKPVENSPYVDPETGMSVTHVRTVESKNDLTDDKGEPSDEEKGTPP